MQRRIADWKRFTAVEQAKGYSGEERADLFWRYGALARTFHRLAEGAGTEKAQRHWRRRVLQGVLRSWGHVVVDGRVARMDVAEERMVEMSDGTKVDAAMLRERLEAEAKARAEAEAARLHAAAFRAFEAEAAVVATDATWMAAREQADRLVRNRKKRDAQAAVRQAWQSMKRQHQRAEFESSWTAKVSAKHGGHADGGGPRERRSRTGGMRIADCGGRGGRKAQADGLGKDCGSTRDGGKGGAAGSDGARPRGGEAGTVRL